MSYDNTLNNILNTLVTCYWELPWANTLNNVTNSLKNRNSYVQIYVVNSSATVHIMMQFLLTCGHTNIHLHEVKYCTS